MFTDVCSFAVMNGEGPVHNKVDLAVTSSSALTNMAESIQGRLEGWKTIIKSSNKKIKHIDLKTTTQLIRFVGGSFVFNQAEAVFCICSEQRCRNFSCLFKVKIRKIEANNYTSDVLGITLAYFLTMRTADRT